MSVPEHIQIKTKIDEYSKELLDLIGRYDETFVTYVTEGNRRDEKLTVKQLAIAFGISKARIRTIFAKSGIKWERNEDNETVLPYGVASDYMDQNGHGRRSSGNQVRAIVEALIKIPNMTLARIAAAAGVSTSTVSKIRAEITGKPESEFAADPEPDAGQVDAQVEDDEDEPQPTAALSPDLDKFGVTMGDIDDDDGLLAELNMV